MVNIGLDLLQIFYEVAKLQSITKASEVLFISQPAVSQSIKKLESQLGGTLLIRNNKGITLTEEGKCFYEYVKVAIETIESGTDEFDNFKGLNKGVVRIGISTTLTKLVLVNVLKKFHTQYQKIDIQIYNGLTSNLISKLENGSLDIVIYNSELKSQNSLTSFSHCFVYNPEFYKFKKPISVKELIKNYPLILQDKQSNTRTQLDKFLGVDLKPKMEVVSQELVSVFSSCGLGIGYTINCPLFLNGLKIVPIIEELPKTSIEIMQSKLLTFATRQFIKTIKEEYKSI